MTVILFKAMQKDEAIRTYMEKWWNALYRKIIACNGNWDKLDILSEMALNDYFENKGGN